MSTPPTPQEGCIVILTLAHLLQQHSLSYDDEKNILLDTSVQCAMKLLSNQNHNDGEAEEVHMVLTGSPRPTFAETNAWLLQGEQNSATPRKKSIGSRNDNNIGGNQRSNENDSSMDVEAAANTPGSFRGSYTILDNRSSFVDNDDDISMASSTNDNENATGAVGGANGAQILQEYIASCTIHNSSTSNANMDDLEGSPTRLGGSVLNLYKERKYSFGDQGAGGTGGIVQGTEDAVHVNEFDDFDFHSENNVNGPSVADETKDEAMDGTNTSDTTAAINKTYTKKESTDSTNSGPMVGQAVVNAISQKSGVGLQSSRAKLLQGTIDRPLWDQRRWTDGECLFSELVDRCGLESFENVGVCAGGGSAPNQNNAVASVGVAGGGGADAAAGGGGTGTAVAAAAAAQQQTGMRLQKTTNLSAHLITVPATIITQSTVGCGGEIPGLAEDIIEEIARGILRCLKRKKSPPASKVYLVLPPDNKQRDEERRNVVSTRLAAAWQKLERYNDMIGAPRLMADAELEFVDVSV